MTKCKSCKKDLFVIPTNHIMFCDEDCLSDYVVEKVHDPDYLDDSDAQYERWRDQRMEAEA